MSQPFLRFGSFNGLAGGDCRIQIGGKGRKNILGMTASYQKTPVGAPGAGFQGRLVIVAGQLDPVSQFLAAPPPDFTIASLFNGQKILFDQFIISPQPTPFLLPIAQQEGSPQSDESATINVILTIATDGAGGVYTPFLAVSGQTVFGGVLAGQQGSYSASFG